MHADYIANPLYDNNPFIEALPPMLSGKDLIFWTFVFAEAVSNDVFSITFLPLWPLYFIP